MVERFLGKEEVGSSILLPGSTEDGRERRTSGRGQEPQPRFAVRQAHSIQEPGTAPEEWGAGGEMADFIQLQCTECERINYSTFRNKKTKQEKLVKKKYCPWDRKHTEHKEVKS